MTGGESNISLWVRSVKERDRELSGIGGSVTPMLAPRSLLFAAPVAALALGGELGCHPRRLQLVRKMAGRSMVAGAGFADQSARRGSATSRGIPA
jgi:hypothetical protein